MVFLAEACCISVITATTVEAVFDDLPPTSERFEATLDDLDDRMMEDGMAFGLLQHGSDVIMVEPNGYQANLPEVMGPVAAGRTVATFYRGGHGVSAFRWYSDGELVVDIEPGIPVPPTELPPDLYTDMQSIGGFLFDDEGVVYPDDHDWESLHTVEASLALIQKTTGLQLTKELLNDSVYAGAIFSPDPSD